MDNLEVGIKLRADVEQLTKGLIKATTQFDGAMGTMRQTAKQTGGSVEASMQKIGLRKHDEIARDIRQVERAYKQLAASGNLTEKELTQASIKTKAKIRELRAETSSWKQALGGMSGELAAAGAALYTLNRVVGAATREAADFGTAMSEVSTLLDDTSGIDGLSESVRAMAREFGGDAQGQAKALYQIISAGASDSATATEQLTAANKLAIGGVTDITTAADGLTSILNSYGEQAGTAADVTDAMFVAMKAGKTTIGELSGSIGQVAPLAAQAGVSMEELLAGTAALTKGGVATSEAMTQLRAIISAVLKPSKEASDIAAELGINFDTAAIRSKGLAGFLEEVKEKTGGNEKTMAALFGRVEALGAVFALTGNGAKDFANTLDSMAEKAGATEDAYAKMAESPEVAAKRFQAAINDMQISVGQAVTALTPVLEWITDAVNGFNDLPAPIRNTTAAIGLAAATIPALALSIGSLVKALGILRSAFAISQIATFTGGLTAATAATGAATVAQTALNKALRAAPWIALAAAIAETTSAAVGWYEATEQAEAAQARADASAAKLAEKFRAISDSTGVTITSIEEFNKAVREGAIAQDEATGKWLNATQAKEAAAAAAEKAAQAEQELAAAAEKASSPLRKEAEAIALASSATDEWTGRLSALDIKAQETKEEITDLVDKLDITDALQVGGIISAIGNIKESSADLGDAIEKELIGRIEKLNAAELAGLSQSIKEAHEQGILSAEEFATESARIAKQASQSMGIDIEAAIGKITEATTGALNGVTTLINTMSGLGTTAEEQSALIAAALGKAFSNAQTQADVDAIKIKVAELGEQGIVTGADLNTLGAAGKDAADRIKASTEKATDSHKTLKKQIRETKTAVDDLKDSTDKLGASSDGTAAALANQIKGLRKSFEEAGEEAAALYDKMVEGSTISGESLELFLNRFNRNLATLQQQIGETQASQESWADRTVDTLDDMSSASERSLQQTLNQAEAMDYLDQSRLDSVRSQVNRLRDANEQLKSSISSTLTTLQDELDQLNDNQTAIEKRRYEEKRIELETQLEQAKATTDRDAETEARKALELLDQIHAKKMQQIEEERREREQSDRERGRERASSQPPQQYSQQPEIDRQPPRATPYGVTERRVEIAIICNNKTATVQADSEQDLIALLEQLREVSVKS